jgi:sugar phosphate isomerase/epimerase
MLRSGLVSISFRKLTSRQVVDLVAQAGLDGIEWGGDIHAPHGNVGVAREVAQMTRDAGLAVAAYGSYFNIGPEETLKFEQVVESAQALGAPLIRVWAGKKGPADADDAYRAACVKQSRAIAEMAAKAGIVVAYEFHRKTLTETNECAVWLLKEVGHPNMKSMWQPRVKDPVEVQLAGLEAVFPWLTNVHCFHWEAATNERLFLEQGAADWRRYLDRIKGAAGDRYVMIEFVKGDAPESFLRDARALKGWL